MFNGASAFNQDLGWCLDVEFEGWEFYNTPCASTSCGVQQNAAGTCAPTPRPSSTPTTAAPTYWTPAPFAAPPDDYDRDTFDTDPGTCGNYAPNEVYTAEALGLKGADGLADPGAHRAPDGPALGGALEVQTDGHAGLGPDEGPDDRAVVDSDHDADHGADEGPDDHPDDRADVAA